MWARRVQNSRHSWVLSRIMRQLRFKSMATTHWNCLWMDTLSWMSWATQTWTGPARCVLLPAIYANHQYLCLLGHVQAWEYMDGWSYRVDTHGPDGETFQLDGWMFSGKNALDGQAVNGGKTTRDKPWPMGTYCRVDDDTCVKPTTTTTTTTTQTATTTTIPPTTTVTTTTSTTTTTTARPGCTQEAACNYDELSKVDDGSCKWPQGDQFQCTAETVADGSCQYDCDQNCIKDVDECGVCGGGGTGNSCTIDLSPGSKKTWRGDTYCDNVNNNCRCGWDLGDCCGVTNNYQFCGDECTCLDPDYVPEECPENW